MVVVQRDSVLYVVAPLPPLHLVDRPLEISMEGGEKGNGLDSGKMLALADI